jgi:hypothetical protein
MKRLQGRELVQAYGRSYLAGLRRRSLFADLEAFCVFVGYPFSGHSLIGSLLDAHPRMAVAHELDALKYVDAGFGRMQLLHLLLENSEAYGRRGRAHEGFSYAVDGQWQGRFEALQVIGDKKGGMSTLRLRYKPGLLDELQHTVRLPLKIVHVMRNPYDNIGKMATRADMEAPGGDPVGLERATWRYFSLHETVQAVLSGRPRDEVFHLRHDDFIADPAGRLAGLCRFLGVEAAPDYLAAGAAIVFPEERRRRRERDWTPSAVAAVAGGIERSPLLSGYRFED